MSKIGKIALGIISASAILIVIGIIILSNESSSSEKEISKFSIISTEGDDVDNSTIEYYQESEETKIVSVNSVNMGLKNKFDIKLSKDLNIFWNDGNSISLSSIYSTVNAYSIYNKDIENYKAELVNSIKETNNKTNIMYLGSDYEGFEYQTEYIMIKGLSTDENNQTSYRERFIILIKESESSIFCISYEIVNKKFTDETLGNFINGIVIDKGKAKYLYSNIEDDKIVGTLTSNIVMDDTRIYKLHYSINAADYHEIESPGNNLSRTTFSSENDEVVSVKISLNVIEDNVSFIESYMNSIRNDFTKLDISLEDISYTAMQHDNKEFYRVNIKYLDINDETKSMYKTHIIYLIDDNLYYDVLFDSSNEPDEDIISDFLDFTLES